jgi:hypothetical protein
VDAGQEIVAAVDVADRVNAKAIGNLRIAKSH